jgi:hypothetical protein
LAAKLRLSGWMEKISSDGGTNLGDGVLVQRLGRGDAVE